MLRKCWACVLSKSTAPASSSIRTEDKLKSVDATENDLPIQLDIGKLLQN